MKNNWITFIKQNGFLIFLFISVLVVATGTILIATENLRIAKEPSEDKLVILDEIKESPNENIEVSNIEEPETSETEKETDESNDFNAIPDEESNVALEPDKPIEEVDVKEIVDNKEIVKEVSAKNEDIEFIDDYEDVEEVVSPSKVLRWMIPVEGKILTEHSPDKLVFSETLEEWRAHLGLDIAAKVGDKVKAPGDGVVKEIKEDELWGITITIDHGKGIESRLSNLGTKELVKEGLEVKYGDYISTVGDTANIELIMAPHLHYEVYKDGKIIDPRSITY